MPFPQLRSRRPGGRSWGRVAAAGVLVSTLVTSGVAGWATGADAATDNQLRGVSCVSAAHCVAVGDQLSGSLVETWNGSTWRVDGHAEAAGGLLTSVSCTSKRRCMAVGYTGVYLHPLAELWNGVKWTIQQPPGPDGTYFLGVSCPGPTECVAVGGQPDGSLAEIWDGTSWTIQSTPNPQGYGNPYAQLEAVSCTGPALCRAVGQWQGYVNGKGAVGATLAEAWTGVSWELQTIPNPRGYGGGILHGLSCSSATACQAVGTRDNALDDPVPLAEGWNGTGWYIEATPYQGIASYTEVDGVSCTGPAACTAAGFYYGDYQTVALRWTGSQWLLQSPPNPSYRNTLNAVSCTGGRHCVAVGTFYDAAEAGFTLVEVWDGTAWTVQTSPNP
jgi:hypothetical protein